MALTQITGPYPIFTDLDGTPLDDGYLYIGEPNQDPETNPTQVFWDSALTIPASQPIRTSNGYAWRNGTPGLLYTAGTFSITIRNKRQEFVLYSPLGYGFDPASVSASVVKNDFTGDGVQVDFTLSSAPSTILATNVFINGVYQDKDSYSLSGNVITFSVAPPLASDIEVMTNETGVINSGNANDISYTLNAPGAVAQSVQTKLQQIISVEDFGAVCDGIADDSTAIQTALDYANSIDGATVTANGICKIGTTVTVKAGTKFLFNVLEPATSSTDVLRIYGGCTVQGKVDTSGFPTYSGNAVIIDGNAENMGSIFRLHIQTDLDLVVNGGGSTGTAIYFKATDTKAWIMNVNLQAEINKFQYGVRMEQTSTDLSKFITSNTMQISTSDTLIALSMSSSHPNHYGLDGNNISIKSQPKPGTTDPIFDICGQANIFDLIAWDWDSVAGTAPYAMTIQQYTRNSEITWRTDFAYISNSSLDLSIVFTILFDNGGPRFPRIFTSRTDNTLPIPATNTVLDNNRFYAGKTTTNIDAPLLGVTSSNDLLIEAPAVAGANILMDTRNATGIYALRINGSNKFFVGSSSISPGADNALANGTSGARWSVVYAATGTINTSDARTKQDVEELDAVEKRVALALKGLIRKFRFKDAIEKKGEAARIHTGVLAQEVEAAFAAEGLDARRYGLLCYDELDEGDIYGIRYDELVMFILGAL